MASKLPAGRPQFQPALEEKRRQLTIARDQLRAQGYEAEINIDVFTVELEQIEGDDDDAKTRREAVQQKIDDKVRTRDAAYAAAHRINDKLLKLPKSKEAKKD